MPTALGPNHTPFPSRGPMCFACSVRLDGNPRFLHSAAPRATDPAYKGLGVREALRLKLAKARDYPWLYAVYLSEVRHRSGPSGSLK